MRIVSTIKSIIIFVLSVALALETGFAVAYGMALKVLHEESGRPRQYRRMSYQDFNRERA